MPVRGGNFQPQQAGHPVNVDYIMIGSLGIAATTNRHSPLRENDGEAATLR
jgi:hypothetical protein